MNTFDHFNNLARLLETECGKDLLMNNANFRRDFSKLQKMLCNTSKVTRIQADAFDLAQTLCKRVERSKKSASSSNENREHKARLVMEYPYLASILQKIAYCSKNEIDSIVSILMS